MSFLHIALGLFALAFVGCFGFVLGLFASASEQDAAKAAEARKQAGRA